MTTADLRPFQRRFLAAALAPGIEVAALSLPRANGKTTLLALLATRALTPGDPLFVEGASNVLIAGSIKQSRPGFRLARAALGEDGYRYEDSNQAVKILHLDTQTRLDVHAANAKTALGWLGARLILVDEGAVVSGDLWDAIATTAGKGETTIIIAGTLAPSGRDDWWPKLVKRGSGPGVHVTVMQGDPDTWDAWPTIRKCNPLAAVNPRLRKTLLRERYEARSDDRLRARFMSLRLNIPTRTDERELIPPHQWEAVLARPVPPREGQAVLGLDLGAARSWSAAALWWRNGRAEVYASIPGIPDIDVQERSLGFGRGVLRSMVDRGTVAVAEGKRVADIDVLLDRLPAVDVQGVVADRFLAGAMGDALAARRYPPVEWRVGQWSTATEDLASFRRYVLDGPLSVAHECRALATLGMAEAEVERDTSGNARLHKRDWRRRDDVAAALLLAGGAVRRWPVAAPLGFAAL